MPTDSSSNRIWMDEVLEITRAFLTRHPSLYALRCEAQVIYILWELEKNYGEVPDRLVVDRCFQKMRAIVEVAESGPPAAPPP